MRNPFHIAQMGVRTQFEMSVTDIDIGRGEEEIWGFVSQWGLARVPLLSPPHCVHLLGRSYSRASKCWGVAGAREHICATLRGWACSVKE